MMNTQEECRKEWEDAKCAFLAKIRQIDNKTMWSETEPKWWLEMMEIERLLLKAN